MNAAKFEIKRTLKTNFIVCIILLTATVFFSSCAPKASGPDFQMIENPPKDKATVYFYRPYKQLGSALSEIAFVDNGTTVCSKVLMNGYCVHFVQPGSHTLSTFSPAVDKQITVDVKPGETLFFKAHHACGVWICSYRLLPIEKNIALEEIADYKLQN